MRTTGDCLAWNNERLRIDLIVERYRLKYAECSCVDTLRGQRCFVGVPASSQSIVMVRCDRQRVIVRRPIPEQRPWRKTLTQPWRAA